jgi:hypothetical protein
MLRPGPETPQPRAGQPRASTSEYQGPSAVTGRTCAIADVHVRAELLVQVLTDSLRLRPSRRRGPASVASLPRVLPYVRMIGKLLVTLAVILAAYAVIRVRMRPHPPAAASPRERSQSPRALRAVAYALMTFMVVGTLGYLFLDWEVGRQVVTVRVINAITGGSTTYRARRADVRDGRRFTAIDGRRVTLADVERMVVEDDP